MLLSWIVKMYDVNGNKIKDYDVLKPFNDDIVKLKKEYLTKEEFSEKLRKEMMYRYWSRSEYELIIKLTEDGRIKLYPWCGCRNPDEVEIDVTEDMSFDWRGFAEEHISKQIYKNEAKIDIYDQLIYRWDEFIEYCWEENKKENNNNNNNIRVNKQYRGIWFDANEITPKDKGWYLVWVENSYNRDLEQVFWNGLFWKTPKDCKAFDYKVTYWTPLLPYPEKM